MLDVWHGDARAVWDRRPALVVCRGVFHPHFHEAIGTVENNEVIDETILEELDGGYLFQGRLLRPSKVRIAKSTKTEEKKEEEKKEEEKKEEDKESNN